MLHRTNVLTFPGIRECEVIQWFVQPEARVQQFDKLCEVQSDKASVEITSRFDGVIKALHYEAGDMALVGKPLVDIDVEEDIKEEGLNKAEALVADEQTVREVENKTGVLEQASQQASEQSPSDAKESAISRQLRDQESVPGHTNKTLATPAVRHLTKELKVDIADITGTGTDGRVLKHDVYHFAKHQETVSNASGQAVSKPSENATHLTKNQMQMFKAMTRSLTIPHFLYTDEIDFSGVCQLRQRLNKSLARYSLENDTKLSFLPFIIKAVSLGLHQYPILNARVDTTDPSKPTLVMRRNHNIGIAMDTPEGLLVPNIKNVSSLSVISIATELKRLQILAKSGKLSSQDLTGGTITISNIGTIGGTYVSPIIVDKEVAILGIGRMRKMPTFDDRGDVVAKEICNFSWSADHRIVDGATMARAAEAVRRYVEEPETMMIYLR